MVSKKPEIGVAYYGQYDVEKARKDFEDMYSSGIDSVLLAVGEHDYWFWGKSISLIAGEAKEVGLKVYLNLWSWGKVFGGEAASLFLQENVSYRQVTNKGRELAAACVNDPVFQKYVFSRVEKLARIEDIDAFFFDEPHFAFFEMNLEDYGFKMLRNEWACMCENCRRLFRERYGYDMPKKLTRDVLEFRQESLVGFLDRLAGVVKSVDSKKNVVVCLLPAKAKGLLVGKMMDMFAKLVGIYDWEKVAELNVVDIVATDPYWVLFEESFPLKLGFNGLKWYESVIDDLLEITSKFGKKSQIWLQGFKVPRNKAEEIIKGFWIAVEKGVDSIFVWPYRAGKYSLLESEDADRLWKLFIRTFSKLKG